MLLAADLHKLSIPRPDDDLEVWKVSVVAALHKICKTLAAPLSLDDHTALIVALVPFLTCPLYDASESCLDAYWANPESQTAAEAVLGSVHLTPPSKDLVLNILNKHLRPIFKANAHPNLHADTGRKLSRPAGGPMGLQDYYEDQRWKDHPAIGTVILWCIQTMQPDDYESSWHLILPPVMTLLDDYEPRYKLQGVIIVKRLIEKVPCSLLKRTGVDELFRQSLRNALANLDNPETYFLVKNGIDALVSLTLHTTSRSVGSKPNSEKFDQLCFVLQEGIISGIWMYSSDKPAAISATFDALPNLLEALSIGSIRFLQSLIPQLIHSLIPQDFVEADRGIQLAALKALKTVLDVAAPRIPGWKATLLDAVGRCWVSIVDEERAGVADTSKSTSRDDVKKALQEFCGHLTQVCPSVQEEYRRLREADEALFEDLFVHVPATV